MAIVADGWMTPNSEPLATRELASSRPSPAADTRHAQRVSDARAQVTAARTPAERDAAIRLADDVYTARAAARRAGSRLPAALLSSPGVMPTADAMAAELRADEAVRRAAQAIGPGASPAEIVARAKLSLLGVGPEPLARIRAWRVLDRRKRALHP